MLSSIKRSHKFFYQNGLKLFPKIFFSRVNDNFLAGENITYLENLFQSWKRNPKSVNISWQDYFSTLDQDKPASSSIKQPKSSKITQPITPFTDVSGSLKVTLLIRAFQTYGFLKSTLDPLHLPRQVEKFKLYKNIENLKYQTFGLTDDDLEKEFYVKSGNYTGILSESKPIKLKDIIDRLKKSYCSSIGVEYMFNHSFKMCNFIREKFENEWINHILRKDDKINLYKRLAWAVLFEDFLQKKFTTHTRFGLEGLETVISGLKNFVDTAADLGIKDLTFGMPHRGRLNVLANVFEKPYRKIFAEFNGKHEKAGVFNFSGDVKYHLGSFTQRKYPGGKTISLDLLPNPSHLEAVNPVVMGKVRAKQHFEKDIEHTAFKGILLHGDAAFAGQGIVYESMEMSHLPNFTSGGVLHVICNNQIGFTTSPSDSRSTPFCTDIGKSVEAPIIHVNADDPIAVDFVFKFAAEFMRKFDHDIIIDLIGYRKHGHNELDQPMFTQPLMYKKVSKQENVLKKYQDRLINEGIPKEELEKINSEIKSLLEQYHEQASKDTSSDTSEWQQKQWAKLSPTEYSEAQITGVNIHKIKEIGEKINTLPQGFKFHPQIHRHYETRLKSIKEGKGIDMTTAEALAFAVLLDQGYTVRLTGQDVERGTFSQRHAVLHDQENDKTFMPLHQILRDNNRNNLQIYNSHLSEFGVLGFELGFSYYNPYSLVIWEAQFGDFANGAQVIIDNFISSAEAKWNVSSGITLFLPHGLDGQGPEHSSCRIERYLQLINDDYRKIPDFNSVPYDIQKSNMQVCYPSFPANYFHLLLRQLKRNFRKPLIVPTSKKLLRFKQATSQIEQFADNTKFIKLQSEKHPEVVKNAENVKRLLICTGQVYYDLYNRREKLKRNDIAIATLEQIAPFPYRDFNRILQQFPKAEIVWVQEEHMNQGAWGYVHPRILSLMSASGNKHRAHVEYCGRAPSSTPATGHYDQHDKELEDFLYEAFR